MFKNNQLIFFTFFDFFYMFDFFYTFLDFFYNFFCENDFTRKNCKKNQRLKKNSSYCFFFTHRIYLNKPQSLDSSPSFASAQRSLDILTSLLFFQFPLQHLFFSFNFNLFHATVQNVPHTI